jgi:hypothetical protein
MKQAIYHQAAKRVVGNRFSPSLGFDMMRDRTVPIRHKLLAVGAGCGLTALLLAFEFPVELLFLIFPIPGMLFDSAVDGIEILFAPLLIACLLLPRLYSRPTQWIEG